MGQQKNNNNKSNNNCCYNKQVQGNRNCCCHWRQFLYSFLIPWHICVTWHEIHLMSSFFSPIFSHSLTLFPSFSHTLWLSFTRPVPSIYFSLVPQLLTNKHAFLLFIANFYFILFLLILFSPIFLFFIFIFLHFRICILQLNRTQHFNAITPWQLSS